MRYRIQVLVDSDRLPAVIEAAFGGELGYDPELKVWPASQPETPQNAAYAATRRMIDRNLYKAPERPKDHSQVGGVHRETLLAQRAARSRYSKPNMRAELVEAALKTGPKRWSDLRTALATGGLSESSLNSLISKWQKAGKIVRQDGGLWSLTYAEAQKAHAG
jgi:hypothetical protein